MTQESMSESEFVSDEMQTTDSYAVNEEVTEDAVSTPSHMSRQPGLLRQILGFFYQSPATRASDLARRLRELNVSIEVAPESPTNYVLRGEVFLERKEYHLAKADFETALELAEAFDATDGWGLIEQVMRDRALDGMKKVQRNLS